MIKAANDNRHSKAAADARSAATLVDLVVVLPCAVAADPFAQAAHAMGAPWWGSLLAFGVAWPLVTTAALAAFESSRLRATPGKLACGLRVEAAGGGRAGFGACLKRNLYKYGLGILGVPHLAASGWAPGGGLHDRRAGTAVMPRGHGNEH